MNQVKQKLHPSIAIALTFVACLATEAKVSAAGVTALSCQAEKDHLVCRGTPFVADIHASKASITSEDFSPPWWKGAHATPSYSFSQNATPAESLSPQESACGKQQLSEFTTAVRGSAYAASPTVVQIDVNDYEGASPLLLVNSDGAQNYKPARSLASSVAPTQITITPEHIYLRANIGGGEGCEVVSSADIKAALDKEPVASAKSTDQKDRTLVANQM
jgi:hypothetical protein